MIHRRQAGHPGGCLSAAEIMAALFFHKLRLDPANPAWPERDRFILSKGHASALLYAALAQRGFFPRSDLEELGRAGLPPAGSPRPAEDARRGYDHRHPGPRHRHRGRAGAGGPHAETQLPGLCAAGRRRMPGRPGLGRSHDGRQVPPGQPDRHRRLTTTCSSTGRVHEIMPLEPMADKWRRLQLGGAGDRRPRHPPDARGAGRGRGDPRPAHGHHRPHHQGQRRFLHGKRVLLARHGAQRRRQYEQARRGAGRRVESWPRLSMREAYGRALADYGALNPDVVALDADTSASTLSTSSPDVSRSGSSTSASPSRAWWTWRSGWRWAGLIPFVNAFRGAAGPARRGADPHLRLLCPHQRQAGRQLRRAFGFQRRADAPRHHRHRHYARPAGA